jgi:hypothetical protein
VFVLWLQYETVQDLKLKSRNKKNEKIGEKVPKVGMSGQKQFLNM